jgi:hypothetical protein
VVVRVAFTIEPVFPVPDESVTVVPDVSLNEYAATRPGIVLRIVVKSLAVLFPAVASPPPDTTAVLVTLEAALAATVTVRVIAGYAADAARAVERLQLNVGVSVQLHPVPAIAVAVNPVGSVSVIVTVPLVGPVPTFDTVIVYVAPV